MVKRLLAFVLTAAMVIETPATALAAEQIPVAVEENEEASEEEVLDESSADETENEVEPNEVEDGDDGEPVDDGDNGDDGVTGVVDDDNGVTDGDVTAEVDGDNIGDGEEELDENPLGTITLEKAEGSEGEYDFSRTFKITDSSAEGDGFDPDGTYKLGLSIKKSSDISYTDVVKAVKIVNSGDAGADEYQITVKSTELLAAEGDGVVSPLLPDTSYDLKWSLIKEAAEAAEDEGTSDVEGVAEGDNETVIATLEETAVKTSKATVNITEAEDAELTYNVALAQTDVTNISAAGQSISLDVYVAETNKATYTVDDYADIKLKFNSVNGYSTSLDLNEAVENLELEAETDYVFALCNEDGSVVYATQTFTTPESDEEEDSRTLEITSAPYSGESGNEVLTINYKLSGALDDQESYVILYYYAVPEDPEGESEILSPEEPPQHITGNGTGSFTIRGLEAGITYRYVLGIGDSAETDFNDLKARVVDEFVIEAGEPADARIYDVRVDEKETGALITYSVSDADPDDFVVLYYKEADADEWIYHSSLSVNEEGAFTLEGLTTGVTYKYLLGIAGREEAPIEEFKDSFEDEFTPHAINRTVKVIAVEADITTATIEWTAKSDNKDDIIICYYREYDEQNPQEWNWVDYWWPRRMEPFYLENLKPETTYEYLIGYGADEGTAAEDLSPAVSDKFTTLKDTRELSDVTVEARIRTAKVSFNVNDAVSGSDRAVIYYRAKTNKNTNDQDEPNPDEEAQEEQGWESTSAGVRSGAIFLSELTAGTTYEYKIGLGNEDSSIDELEKALTGEFTTLADQRVLSDAQVVAIESGQSSPGISIDAVFSGNIDGAYTYITYFYRKKGSDSETTDWSRQYATTSADTASLHRTISGLEWSSTYEYAITISDGSVYNPDEVKKEGWKLTGEVAIAAAEAPTSITLSKSALYLNISSTEYDEDKIKVNVEPATANKDVIVSIDPADSNLVSISQSAGNITVSANATGTVKLTIKSKYNESVSAECTVEVADYRVLYKDKTGNLGSASVAVYGKGLNDKTTRTYSEETWHLYKVDSEGQGTEIAEYTAESKNTSIADWEDSSKKFWLKNVSGTTKVVFSDGNFKAEQLVRISSETKSIDILRLEEYDGTSYEAIADNDTYTIPYSESHSIKYKAIVEEGPYDAHNKAGNKNLKWEVVTGEDYVSVNSEGIITAKAPGTATIKVSYYTTANNYFSQASKTITVKVLELPDDPTESVYALADTVGTLENIKCPDGWKWVNPETPIFVNKNDGYSYRFEAESTAANKYPLVSAVTVYMADVTGVGIYSTNSVDGVFETTDTLNIRAYADAVGYLNVPTTSGNGYNDFKVEIQPVKNLEIQAVTPTEEESYKISKGIQDYTIKASKAGTYTLKAVVTATDSKGATKTLAQNTYKVKAVEGPLATDIEIKVTTTGVTTDEDSRNAYVDIGSTNSVDTINLEATVKKITYNNTEEGTEPVETVLNDVNLTWKSSDTKVAKITADKTDSHKATVKVAGEGHAVLTATTKDAAGRSQTLRLEIRNHAPRIDVSKVTVNTAFDYITTYPDDYGLGLGYSNSGAVEVVPVYGETVSSSGVKVYEKGGSTISADLAAYYYRDVNGTARYVIGTKKNSTISKGGDYELHVTTSTGETYTYPLKVTVVNKPAKITAKSDNTVNLFYRDQDTEVKFKVSGAYNGIRSVEWVDNSSSVGNGFVSDWDGYGTYWYAEQENISLTDKNKLADADIVKGKFKVKLYGYRDTYEVPYTIKWKYKKPSIVTKASSTTVLPSVNINSSSFSLYNKTDKEYLEYFSSSSLSTTNYYYDDITSDNRNVTLDPRSSGYYLSYVSYTYKGKVTGSEKIKLTIKSAAWREPLTATHTIKMAKPTATLSRTQITLNTNEVGTAYTNVQIKNHYNSTFNCDGIAVEGKDAKSAKLLDDNLLHIAHDNYHYVANGYINENDNNYYDYSYYYDVPYRVAVRLNRTSATGQEVAPGTYTYKITPSYTDADGNKQTFKTMTLKVKVVDKETSVKVKAKGSLDLVKVADYYDEYEYYNYMELTPAFSNIGTGYSVIKTELVGEYSKYFKLGDYYDYDDHPEGYTRLYIDDSAIGKLKAKQKYKLAVKYTIKMDDRAMDARKIDEGDVFTVTSSVFTVTPKQTTPRVTVATKNITLFAGADRDEAGSIRSVRLDTPSFKQKINGINEVIYAYKITDAYGYLDCNKDGRPDIEVEFNYSSYNYAYVYVSIIDRDAVLAASGKGKSLSIPVTVEFKGRDGISKDAKTAIKVSVKR